MLRHQRQVACTAPTARPAEPGTRAPVPAILCDARIARIGRLTCTASLAAAALAAAWPAAAPAQAPAPGVGGDVRCLLLSAGYVRQAKDDASRRAAGMTGAFYLGRLDGRLSQSALTAAIRAQGQGLPAKDAEPVMRACAARAAAAEQVMTAAAKAGQTGQ